jgi:hypothetical protein
MRKLLFFVLALSLHCAANAADNFSTLEERMSGKEFKETGLGKLTDEELAALNEWVRRHSVATLENAAARPTASAATMDATEDLRGFENQKKGNPDGNIIHGTIVGKFSGWKEKGQLFKLTNGMIWRQDDYGTFYVKPAEDAEITIEKGFLGVWHLSMVGHGSEVRVVRVK